MKKIAVILPAFDEEVTIGNVIEAFHDALPEAQIHVINNNSADRTRDIAIATLARLSCPGSVIDEVRQGKGNAVRRAFLDIEADVYVLADADLTYPANRAKDLIAPVLEGRADMVVGDRHSSGQYAEQNTRRWHGPGNELVKRLINRIFGASLKDILSGYRAFSRVFIKNYPVLTEGFQVETELTLHALDKRFRILEVPVEYLARPPGSTSKLNTVRDGTRVLFTIVQILRYYRPLWFFGALAIFAGLAGLLAGVPVFDDWLNYRYIYHVPLAILASALELVALGLLGIGLVLDSVAHQYRMSYELHLLRGR